MSASGINILWEISKPVISSGEGKKKTTTSVFGVVAFRWVIFNLRVTVRSFIVISLGVGSDKILRGCDLKGMGMHASRGGGREGAGGRGQRKSKLLVK